MFIVLLGAPGSGKGTLGKILSEKLGIPHISTGELFRKHISAGTELGEIAKTYINNGELVPDEITIKVLYETLNGNFKKGAIFDGFPRTERQAEELEEMLEKENTKVKIAVNLDVPFEEIINRISNRRVCKNCSAIYNVLYKPPKIENICDECGGELYQRGDQKPEIVNNRLEVYKNTSSCLIDYYKRKRLLYNMKAGNESGKTSSELANELEEYIKNI